MIRAQIQIGSGAVTDTFDTWGLIYVDADKRTEAPLKERDVTNYIGTAGENMDPRTVQAPFDYTVTFLIEAPNSNASNANALIAAFNKALYTTANNNTSVRVYKTVTFYNLHDRVKIVGIPDPIAEPKSFYRRQDGSVMDCVEVELKIRVTDPKKCNFDLKV